MKEQNQYSWSCAFYAELANKRKVALRMGVLQERNPPIVYAQNR